MNRKEWIRNLNATMEYYADFYGGGEKEITEVYKKEIEQYADLMANTKSFEKRMSIMDLCGQTARSWAWKADEDMNRKYFMTDANPAASERINSHLQAMANRAKGYLFNDKVDMETLYQYAKGCNIYNRVLTRNARRLQADLIR